MRDKLERLTEVDFNKLSKLINTNYGIKLPISKKLMIEGRLRKRLKANSIDTFNEYVEYVFSDIGLKKELVHMIDVVSTNKTDFFREPSHFDYLTQEILPKFLKEKSGKPLKIWSSACSTGEEPYTIAIVIEEFLKGIRSFDYTIHCTDISTQVLKKAVDGIYNLERIEKVPIDIKRKYFLKSKDPQKNIVRIIPELRKKLTVRRLNLIDDLYKTPHDFDIIFCRNVLIYFDKPTQESVINKLSKKLRTGGIFFLGHSESLTGIKAPLKSLKPTTFVKI